MQFILVEDFETLTGTHPRGKVVEEQSAHLLRSSGATLLPYDEGNDTPNSLSNFSSRLYSGLKTSPVTPTVVMGPIVYLSMSVRVYWALNLRVPKAQGRVSIIASTQQGGKGMVRTMPLEQSGCDLGDYKAGIVTLKGDFYANPMQQGFAAFDYYVISPQIMEPIWSTVTLMRER